MNKLDTEHTIAKSDSKKLAKKLKDLQEKLSKKTLYAVKKHYDVYAVAEISTNKSVVKDLPNYEIADILTIRLNREITTPEIINQRISPLLDRYYHFKQEIVYFKNIIDNSNSYERRMVMYDRILDSNQQIELILRKIRSTC